MILFSSLFGVYNLIFWESLNIKHKIYFKLNSAETSTKTDKQTERQYNKITKLKIACTMTREFINK